MSQLSQALQPVHHRGAHGSTQPLLIKGAARWPDPISFTLKWYECSSLHGKIRKRRTVRNIETSMRLFEAQLDADRMSRCQALILPQDVPREVHFARLTSLCVAFLWNDLNHFQNLLNHLAHGHHLRHLEHISKHSLHRNIENLLDGSLENKVLLNAVLRHPFNHFHDLCSDLSNENVHKLSNLFRARTLTSALPSPCATAHCRGESPVAPCWTHA